MRLGSRLILYAAGTLQEDQVLSLKVTPGVFLPSGSCNSKTDL